MIIDERWGKEEITQLIDSTLRTAENNYQPFRAEEFVWRFGAGGDKPNHGRTLLR